MTKHYKANCVVSFGHSRTIGFPRQGNEKSSHPRLKQTILGSSYSHRLAFIPPVLSPTTKPHPSKLRHPISSSSNFFNLPIKFTGILLSLLQPVTSNNLNSLSSPISLEEHPIKPRISSLCSFLNQMRSLHLQRINSNDLRFVENSNATSHSAVDLPLRALPTVTSAIGNP
uniref:Uncharacterized protein n=1 Tax=Salix viminalis TaxID=40686 RepID=A0A6N2KNG3_SALVM